MNKSNRRENRGRFIDSYFSSRRREEELGRFPGINRHGEVDPHPADYRADYEDERGMKHPYENAGHYNIWSRDSRSSASSERNFAGRGPKGYVRSDERIREEVCEKLTAHSEINPRGMQVTVSEGLVTLEGVVESRQQKRSIEDLVDEVVGIKDIHNHLTIDKHVEGWIPHLGEVNDDNEYHDDGHSLTKGLY
jgi:hypothetical protein